MNGRSVVYEITAEVDAEICVAYEEFMQTTHIPDLLATGLFMSASFETSAPGRYRIRYHAENRDALDQYLSDHAPRLRRHVFEHFPNGVELTREEWTVIKHFA